MTASSSGSDEMIDREQQIREEALMWLKDAPLFIDSVNLARVYDAVVRPVYKEDAPVTIKVSAATKKELEGKLQGKANAGLAPWMSYILKMSAEAEAGIKKTGSKSDAEETTITLYPISTPQRQLEQLAIWYFFNNPDQLLVGTKEHPQVWQRDQLAQKSPRALVFLDLPKGTKLIPMAAELTNGCVETFFDKMRAEDGKFPPKKFSHEQENEYWKWFDDNFDPQNSVELIETAVSRNQSKIEWIDFRAPISSEGDTIHFHLVGNGDYSAGVFAYNLVRRTLGHGIKIVGTLKDGPALNVLAVYEK